MSQEKNRHLLGTIASCDLLLIYCLFDYLEQISMSFYRYSNFAIEGGVFDNYVSKTAAILSRPLCSLITSGGTLTQHFCYDSYEIKYSRINENAHIFHR